MMLRTVQKHWYYKRVSNTLWREMRVCFQPGVQVPQSEVNEHFSDRRTIQEAIALLLSKWYLELAKQEAYREIYYLSSLYPEGVIQKAKEWRKQGNLSLDVLSKVETRIHQVQKRFPQFFRHDPPGPVEETWWTVRYGNWCEEIEASVNVYRFSTCQAALAPVSV